MRSDPRVSSDSGVADKGQTMMTGVDGETLAGRLTGALYLERKEGSNERNAEAGTTDGGEKSFAFYARVQRADRGCVFVDVNGFSNYVYVDKLGRVDKEKSRKKEGAEVKVAGKRLIDGSGEGTGENRQQNE